MKSRRLNTALFSTVIIAVSSTGWTEETVKQKPIDCSTAKSDIAHLHYEQISTEERRVHGVLSILPIGLAINAASAAEDEGSAKEIKIEEYQKKLQQRIDAIKKECGSHGQSTF